MKLGREELEYIRYFENMTKAKVKDCVIDGNNVVIVVEPGNMGPAIGRKGENIKRIKDRTNKEVSVVEYSPQLNRFLQNLFAPARLEKIEINENKANISTDERKRVIGQKGNRIKRAKMLMKRYFGIEDINIR